jgi:hypothetical protein
MKLAKALKEKTMDIRLVDRLVGEGKVSQSEYNEHISAIEDDEGKYEIIGANSSTATEVTE